MSKTALHWSADAGIDPGARGPVSWDTDELLFDPEGLPDEVLAERPHLRGYLCLRLNSATAAQAERILCGQVVLSLHHAPGRLVNAGALQLPGVLDDVYAAATGARLARLRLLHVGQHHTLPLNPPQVWFLKPQPM